MAIDLRPYRFASDNGERWQLLQNEIGDKTDSPAELHRRALLVTALRDANLYPTKKPDSANG